MSQNSLPPEVLELLIDPYAVLGVSVNADERQILKRYHALAKQLHPDNYVNRDDPNHELATIVFTRLINPAYQQLKQVKTRFKILGELRLKAVSLDQQTILELQSAINLQIMPLSLQETNIVYEQAIAAYANKQYQSLQKIHQVTQYILRLNLVYLSLHKKNSLQAPPLPAISTSTASVSIVPRPSVQKTEIKLPKSKEKDSKPVSINYAQRHYERAVEYGQQAKWALAVQELRDAIKLEPNNSDHYALLGVIHFQQNFPGMAKVYIRQSLKLNPKQPLALKYAGILKIQNAEEETNPKSIGKALSLAALLSRFISGNHS
ncbi:DnaJ domain-containing protein [Anabaena cylindrica FACHB-243]|nr:DnaJ domain-containing protein [Anabaena cylindrica]MBD2418801.1 DnaJ domain-containing protein [Anabaena cylindrica FACHB-243]MBY5283309.1 DnaJ domain-containing protein [Anabaena sp. CCAP 1446/1C]MBY5306784.1 DnaJ domain-containing protein [Anabaena sp. CCAP 1446/1C]MCM2406366.1 DnaJ domain-containing protein [Anabaena sp. CCAP 1446/1C]